MVKYYIYVTQREHEIKADGKPLIIQQIVI